MPTDFRTVPRFFIMTALPATFGGAEVNVVDLSVRGARVQATQPFAIGAVLPFLLQSGRSVLTANASVSWCRMAALSLDDLEADRYLLGLNFDAEVSEAKEIIDDLLARELVMRIEDARASERYMITSLLTGSFGIYSPARLLDLSIHGARIGTDRQVMPETTAPLRFRIEKKNLDLNAAMVWCRPAERRGGFETGLRIDGEEPLLRQVIAHLCTNNQARIDLNSLRRKFDPMKRGDQPPGLLALA